MFAVMSSCGTYRYRLERNVQLTGKVFAYFGVNGATATADVDDHTVRKWHGFTLRNDGCRFIVGNVFGFRATDVRELASAADPVGPDNLKHIREIIADAEILVPCWGRRSKVPPQIRDQFLVVSNLICSSGKPVKIFGLTADGDPAHPLTLGYDRSLIDWSGY